MENRTREALHRVADGLLVSDHDMDRMEEDIMTRLDGKAAPRELGGGPRRRWDWVVAAIALLALAVGGMALWRADDRTPPASPSPSGTRTSGLMAPDLVGLWHNVGGSWVWEFASDGRFGYSDTSYGYLRGEALRITTTDRRGDVYTVSEVEGAETCISEFWVRTTVPDKATITVMRSQCHGENVGSDIDLERVSPRNGTSAPLEPHLERESARAVTSVQDLFGTWVEPSSGTVLAVGGPREGEDTAAYSFDDDGDGSVSADRRGVIRLARDGSLAEERKTGGGGCGPVFSSVRTDKATLIATTGKGGCGRAGLIQIWVRITD